MKLLSIAGVLAGIALVAGVAVQRRASGGTRESAAPDSGRIAVLGPTDVARVQRSDLIAGVPVSGSLQPSVTIRITSPIPEVVDAVSVKEGQAVRRGQVLAQFRTTALAPALLSADAQRAKAAADLTRMQSLFNEGAIARTDLEAAEVTLRAAEANAAQAQKRLDEATVRAPANGVISERHVQAGDRVKDGDALFQLVNIATLDFEATVPSEFAAGVRPGQAVVLAVSGLAARTISGRVARVNATVDPATRQLKLYVSVPNRNGGLVGGLFASGRVVQRQAEGVLVVPRAAVRAGANGTSYVLVVDSGAVALRDVTIGIVDDQTDLVEVTAGVQEGETVIVGGAPGLVSGQRVRVLSREH